MGHEIAISFVQVCLFSYTIVQLARRVYSLWKQRETPKTETPQTEASFLLNREYKKIKEIPENYLSGQFSSLIPICPITRSPVRYAVRDPRSGQIFEKIPLEEWVKANKTSPITREFLTIAEIYPDQKAQFWIEFFLKSVTAYLQKKAPCNPELESK